MDILLLTAYFPPEITAAGHLYFELAKSLTQKGHKCTVVTCMPRWRINEVPKKYRRKLFMREELDGIEVIRVKILPLPLSIPWMRGLDHFLVSAEFLIAALFAGKRDVSLVYSPPLPLGLTAFVLNKIRKMPFVFNVQDIFPQYAVDNGVLKNRLLIKFFEMIESFVYRKARYISVHSPGNREYLASKGVPKDKLVVVPNWVNTERIKPGERHNEFRQKFELDDKFVVSYAGTIGYAQDVNVIVECAKLLESQEQIQFLLVGDGPDKGKVVRKAQTLGLHNVLFLPLQPWEKYPEVLNASDVSLVNLKKSASTPVVPSKILSIMASGTPVVASIPSKSDACKMIEEAECGFVVPPVDPHALAEAVLKLYENPSLAEKMGKNGRSYVEKHYSLEVCTQQYERLFAEMLGRTGS